MLGNAYWLETEGLSRTDAMLILFKKRLVRPLAEWAEKHCASASEVDVENLPENYMLLRISGPSESFPGIPALTVFKEKEIRITDGLKFNFRTYFNGYAGDVEMKNALGNESLIVVFKSGEKLPLVKKQGCSNRWLLPGEIPVNVDFNIKAVGELHEGSETAYAFTSMDNTAKKLKDTDIPKRGRFGEIMEKETDCFAQGSNIMGIDVKQQIPYVQFFKNINENPVDALPPPVYGQQPGNILLAYLSAKQVTSVEDFYSTFEYLYFKNFTGGKPPANFSAVKKSSINYYDYLGYCDYDYESKKIFVNPPQLVLIPSDKGRSALLIGGRDNSLVSALILQAGAFGVQVEIKSQSTTNAQLLLPDAVILISSGSKADGYGLRQLVILAGQMKIRFNPDDLTQVSLQLYSSGIEEYKRHILVHNQASENDYGWVRAVFNQATLEFEKDDSSFIDRSFSLIEYKFNEYTFIYKIWINDKCYEIDRNWGKYLALKYYGRQVIMHGNNKLAIPLKMPLPRLLAESILLLSGIAPEFVYLNGLAYRLYHNIPSPFAYNLFLKLGQTAINQKL